jgi:hypothetical protein
VQCGQWREHEDGEGRSSGKKDGGTAHQWGLSADEVADGAAWWHFFEGGDAQVSFGDSGGVLQHGGVEGGEGGRSIEEEGCRVGSPEEDGTAGVVALRSNFSEGRGPGAQAPSRRGCGVKEGGRWGAQAAKVWSGKERGDGAAMAALIAVCEREREGGGPGCVHTGRERKGVRAWTARGRVAAVERGHRALVTARGRRCRVTHGSDRGRERGSWQVGRPMGWTLPISEERERELIGGSRWRVGPVSNGLQNNPNFNSNAPKFDSIHIGPYLTPKI